MSDIVSTFAEPPPRSPTLDGELFDDEQLVGWLGPESITFRGFDTAAEAAHAAWVAYRALEHRFARKRGGRMIPIDVEPLALVREGNSDHVYAGHRFVARLLTPELMPAGAPGSFGFELRLEGPTDELTLRANAHVAYRALRRSGVRWSMWKRPRATEPAPVRAAAPETMRAATNTRRMPSGALAVLRAFRIALRYANWPPRRVRGQQIIADNGG